MTDKEFLTEISAHLIGIYRHFMGICKAIFKRYGVDILKQ